MNTPRIIIDFNADCDTCRKPMSVVPDRGGCGCTTAQVPKRSHSPNSPCVECETPCDDIFQSDCWQYSGGDIPQLGIKHGDLGTPIIIKFAAEIIALKQQIALLS